MKNSTFTLFIEIDNYNLTFFVCESDIQNYFKIIFKSEIQLDGNKNIVISDFNEVFSGLNPSDLKNLSFTGFILLFEERIFFIYFTNSK